MITTTTHLSTLSLHDALPIFYRSAHKFEQICRHRLRRQNVGYRNFSQPQSHLSFCVLLQDLVERRRVVTQLRSEERRVGKEARSGESGMALRGACVRQVDSAVR